MRRNPPAKWVLPNTVHPATSTSWCVPVPDDPFYRAAFLGALASLGAAYKWQDDADHTAKEVADVWREIADNLQKCMDEPQSSGSFALWEDEVSLHCNIRIHNGKLQVTNGCDCDGAAIWADVCSDGSTLSQDGTITPDSGDRPGPGDSECLPISLAAGKSFIIPFGLQSGDIVTATGLQGSWSSNGVGWTCTDGTPFALGQCDGERYHDVGDPDATLYHGQLALFIGGQYLSLTDGPITLSGLSGSQQGIVIGNMTAGFGAGGTIGLNLCVQSGATPPITTWCHYLDLTLSSYGFYAPSGNGQWVAGVGLMPFAPGDSIDMHRDFSAPVTITYMKYWYLVDGSLSGCDANAQTSNNDGVAVPAPTASSSVQNADAAFVSVNPDYIRIVNTGCAGETQNIAIALEVHGTGTDPFGTSNC